MPGFRFTTNTGATLFNSTSITLLPPDTGSVFGNGFPTAIAYSRLQAVRYVLATFPAPLPQNVDMQLRLERAGGLLTDWATVVAGGENAMREPLAPYIDLSTTFRELWVSIGRADIVAIHVQGSSTAANSRIELEQVIDDPINPTTAFGGFAQFSIAQESTGRVAVGDLTRSRTFARSRGLVELGGATLEGSIFATSGRVAVGDNTQIAVYWPTRGLVRFGGATRDRNRFVVPLRLKAGMVDQDVGYMWVPVYLQLPTDPHVADWPWEFYYPNGRKIPHLRRNRVDHQVRALCYMRPSVSVAQEFFCRVG